VSAPKLFLLTQHNQIASLFDRELFDLCVLGSGMIAEACVAAILLDTPGSEEAAGHVIGFLCQTQI
jgi:hypothetical protein